MAAKNRTEALAEFDAICDEFEQAFAAHRRTGRKLPGIEHWVQRVDPEFQEWLKEELEELSRELRTASNKKAKGRDVPDGIDPGIWRSILKARTFQALSRDARHALARGIEPRQFKAGETLLKVGQRSAGLYLILDGDTEIILNDGKRTAIDVSGRGSVVGEISTITGELCTADVIAVTDVRAMALPVSAFHQIRDEHPEIEIALTQLVSDRLGHRERDALCGKKLDRYRPKNCIGTGAMGVVYEAVDESNGERYALKMLRHRFIYNAKVVSRFEQEADLLSQLNHPNIVAMRGHFIAYKTGFIVLDLYDGTDFRALLRDYGPVDEATARGVIGQIAAGLQYAHQAGVLHLDLKPANVLINRSGHVAITDFGLGKLIESEDGDSEAVGTPLYMPPEQFSMTDVGTHCDCYALGCIAYELIMGERLFGNAESDDIFAMKSVVPNADWPHLDASDEYRDMVHQAVQPSARDRHVDLDLLASWAHDVPDLGAMVGQQNWM